MWLSMSSRVISMMRLIFIVSRWNFFIVMLLMRKILCSVLGNFSGISVGF